MVRLGTFVAAAEALESARKDITDRRATPEAAYEIYTRVVDSALAVGGALTGGEDAELGPDARVLLEFARAGELLSREDALLAVPGPRTAETLRQLTGAIEARRALTDSAARDLPAAQQAAWQSVAKSAAYADLTGAEDRALAAGTSKDSRGAPAGWEAAHSGIGASMLEIEESAHAAATDRADPLAEGALSPAGAAVLLGLAAVAASLVISVRIGRALVVELVSLRNTALEIAHRKLPQAMERLRAGEDIDVTAETPPGPPADDEITQVGEALGTVHRAALSAAVERAELASGISGVFVNLARRSQVLVHKQLTLLDSMERRADDPNELGDLFRLDHLTTRMRRHAESLIILSGAAPGRAWRMPVPSPTSYGPRSPRSRSTRASRSASSPRPPWSGAPSPTSPTCSPNSSRTPHSSPRPTPRSGSAANPSAPATSWRSRTAGSAWAAKPSATPTAASSSPRRSTSSTATGSGSSWSAASRPATE